MNEMISLGAGINSVAMTILLVERGWRGYVVFSDTGGEKPDTYCYLDYFETEFLRPRELTIVRLRPGSEYHCSMSQVLLEEYCLREGRVPLAGMRWCSSRWKGRPLDKWARDHDVAVQLMGIAVDESRRTQGKPPQMRFPLVDEGVTREGCRQIILKAGLVEPLWSSCFFCPGQTYGEWRHIHDHYPALWERARLLERQASRMRGLTITLNSHMSLDQMVERGWGGQLGFDLAAWLPCVCRL